MTIKQTAQNLIDKYNSIIAEDIIDGKIIYGVLTFNMAKNCAKLFCDEMLIQLNTIDFERQSEDYTFLTDFYIQVKQEIEKL
jgi:hypothetical protein